MGFKDTFLILVQYSLRRMARRRMLRPPRAALMTIPEMLECAASLLGVISARALVMLLNTE